MTPPLQYSEVVGWYVTKEDHQAAVEAAYREACVNMEKAIHAEIAGDPFTTDDQRWSASRAKAGLEGKP